MGSTAKPKDLENQPLLGEPEDEVLISSQKMGFCDVMKDLLKNLKISLPSCFSLGDYMIVLLITKALLAFTQNLELTTATGYMTTFFSLLLFAIGYGLNESIGIYCAQAWGSEDRKDRDKMFLMFKQACLIMVVYYIIVTVPLSFFFEDFLLGTVKARPLVAAYAKELVLYCIPGLFIRSLTDIFKSYAQAQEIIEELGYFTLVNLVTVPFQSYFFIVFLEMGAMGMGMSLLVYELGNTLIAAVVFKNMIKDECKTTSYKLSHNFCWFFVESIKNTLTTLHILIAYESVTLIIAMLHDDGQLGAYSILITVGEALRLIAKGFIIYGRTQINKFIGRGLHQTAKSLFFKVLVVLICFSALVHVIMFGVFSVAFTKPLVHPDIQIWFTNSLVLMCIVSFINFNATFALSGMLILEKKCELIIYSYLSAALLMPFLCYWLAVKWKMQLTGVWIAFLIEQGLSTVGFFVLIAIDKWDGIKGIKQG